MTIGSLIESTGNYNIKYNPKLFVDHTQTNKDCIDYALDTLEINQLEILKLDKVNKTVSGTFEFTVSNDCDTLQITEGRFDDFYRE